MDHRWKAVFFLTLVNCLWGMSFPTVKALNAQLDRHFATTRAIDVASHDFRVASATWIIGLRFGFAFILVLILYRSMVRETKWAEWGAGAVIGALFLIGLILQTMGLATIPASRSGFLTSLSVVFTPIIVAVSHGRRPSGFVFLGILVAVLGVSILTEHLCWSDDGPRIAPDAMQAWTIGDTLTTIASVFFSLQIFFVDRFGKKMNSTAFTPGMFAAVAILAVVLFVTLNRWSDSFAVAEYYEVGSQMSFWPLVLMLSIFPSLIAFSWMNTYQPFVTANQAAVIYTMEPVFVSSWALFLPAILSELCKLQYANEQLHLPMLIGGGLILIANVLAIIPSKSEEPIATN